MWTDYSYLYERAACRFLESQVDGIEALGVAEGVVHHARFPVLVARRGLVAASFFAAVIMCARIYGDYRWNAGTRKLRARLDAARVPASPQTVDFHELEGLPGPVRRYLRQVLREGQPMVTGVRVEHSGTFNMGQTSDRWKPFASDQKVVLQRPGFDWNGRVAMMPGLPVRVHDAYITGEGTLNASVIGLLPVADVRGEGAVAEGELMRFFGLLCDAVVLTWLYNRSGGSVLLCVLWHSNYNLVTAMEAVRGTVAAPVTTLVIVQGVALVALEGRAVRRGRPSILGPRSDQDGNRSAGSSCWSGPAQIPSRVINCEQEVPNRLALDAARTE